MQLTSYQKLTTVDRYPECILEKCKASRIEGRGGKNRLRLCFINPDLQAPLYRIAVRTNCLFCFSASLFCTFNVLIKGRLTKVALHKESLKNRFQLTDQAIEEAAESDSLFSLISRQPIKMALKTAKEEGRDLRSSRKTHNLKESFYATQRGSFFFCVHKATPLGKGFYSVVKKAKTPEGEIIARRIHTADKKDELLQELQVMQKLSKRKGHLDLRDYCLYQKGDRWVLVTFHTRFEKDFLDLLFSLEHACLSQKMRLSIADQLFTALTLEGAHCDIKPENILLKFSSKEEIMIAVCDPEFYTEKDTEPFNKGSLRWVAPEVLLLNRLIVKKNDVWPLGILLFYLFTCSRQMTFPWQTITFPVNLNAHIKKLFKSSAQETITQKVSNSSLSKEMKDLLSHMIVVDYKDRWTMEQAAVYFRKHIFK